MDEETPPPATYLHPVWKIQEGRVERLDFNALGDLEAASATGAGKMQRCTKMKGSGQPGATGPHYQCELFQNSPLPTWVRGHATRIYAWQHLLSP